MIYLLLFWEFFKVGLFSFGGGIGMMPLIKDAVTTYGWLSEERFFDLVGVCESTPGPIAVNMATYVGSLQAGFFGSVVATLGVVLPSFLIILLIASLLKNLTKNEWFNSFMKGVTPVVTGLILSMGLLLLFRNLGGTEVLQGNLQILSLIVFSLLTAIYFFVKKLFRKKLSTISLIGISIVLGVVVSLIAELIV